MKETGQQEASRERGFRGYGDFGNSKVRGNGHSDACSYVQADMGTQHFKNSII